ncbi:MAG: hypothetical protein ACI81P_001609 [Neolewinella sp.]|jgi:hypothetical protein
MGSGFRVQGSGFRVQGSGFRVQGSGFRVQGRKLPKAIQTIFFRVFFKKSPYLTNEVSCLVR